MRDGRAGDDMVAMVVGRGALTWHSSVYEPRIRIVFVMFTSLSHIYLYLSSYIYPRFLRFGVRTTAP